MAIPQRFLDELRNRLSLSDIIGSRVKLTRAGREFKACCPFHKEKSPSFTVNDDKQFYHCFGCGAHGGVIDFVMQHDNMSFPEAVELLAGQAGMQMPKQSPAEVKRAQEAKGLFELMDDTTAFFIDTLHSPQYAEAQRYLDERGISAELAAAFRIGFAPADRQALRTHLKGKGYTDKQMIDAGVLRASTKGGEPYAFFRDRVMFPVTDRRGRVVAYGGRILPEHIRPIDPTSSYKPAKYMNSGDTELFFKGQMLYGESQARQAALDGQAVIVTEGYLDVMACYDAGFRGAVAPMGTALTEDQIVNLWKMIPDYPKIPILCFDGDNAGRRAAARAAERILPLLKPDQSARFAFLPDGQDPDSLIRAQGAKAFQAVLDSAIPLVEFIWTHHSAGRPLDTPEARAGLASTLENEALRIADNQVQQYYQRAFKDKLYKAFSPWVNRKYKNNNRRGNAPSLGSATASISLRKPAFDGVRLQQRILLATLLNHPEIFDVVEDDVMKINTGDMRLNSLKDIASDYLIENAGLDAKQLQTYLNEKGFGNELRQVLGQHIYTHAGFAKPATEREEVLEGWRETIAFIAEKTLAQELQQAGRLLSSELNEDNMERMSALYKIQAEKEG
jgi:DNA primase